MLKNILLSLIVFLLLYTAYNYSKEGDISTLTGQIPSIWKMGKKYPTVSKIVQRLRDIIVYKHGYVKWNKFMAIAFSTSVLIVYYFRQKFVIPEILLMTVVIFLAIELPVRWGHAHITKGLDHEASMLYGLCSKYIHKKR